MALGTILLPYDGSEYADALLRLACQLSTGRGRLIALYATRIPSTLPLEPLPAWIDKEGNDMLDRAETIAAAQGVAIETRLIRVRRLVDAIVVEALESEATAIFLPQPSWRQPLQRLRAMSTARSVLRQTSCSVLVGSWHHMADERYQPSASVFDPTRVMRVGNESSGMHG